MEAKSRPAKKKKSPWYGKTGSPPSFRFCDGGREIEQLGEKAPHNSQDVGGNGLPIGNVVQSAGG